MGKESDSSSAISELVQFLEPNMRPDVRHSAIAYIVGISATHEGPKLFQNDDFTLGRALCSLFESTPGDRWALLSALTNIVSVDMDCANFIIERSELVSITAASCHKRESIATKAAKLLSNLSLHFPSKVFERIAKVWESFISDTVALLNESGSADFVDYMGYVLVNCTTMPCIRRIICEHHLASVLPLITQNEKPKRRLIAVDIIRNLCFDDGVLFYRGPFEHPKRRLRAENHNVLLDGNDEFLSCLLKPLADENDNLDEKEIEKLPLQLQYYNGQRCTDSLIVNKLVDALYQLCATKHGRSVLRAKGVYAILRELDKANTKNGSKDASAGGMILLDNESFSSLHALIGVLIRHESEMEIDAGLWSIRHLE